MTSDAHQKNAKKPPGATPDNTGNDTSLEPGIYSDSCERQRHLGSMQAIADEIHRPLDEIAELYEEVLRHLKAQAQILDYLPILVSKRVKQSYRRH